MPGSKATTAGTSTSSSRYQQRTRAGWSTIDPRESTTGAAGRHLIFRRRSRATKQPGRIVFTGLLNHPPNVDAARLLRDRRSPA